MGVIIYTNCIVNSLTLKSHVLSKWGEGLMEMNGLFLGRGSNFKNFKVRDLFEVHQYGSGDLETIVGFRCECYLFSLKSFVFIP